MKFTTTEPLYIQSWCNNPEEGAINQAKNLANLPFAHHHIALMPDTHQGYGMPIGGVLATKGVVIPNAVGVDIGCGMLAFKTDIKELEREDILQIISNIRRDIPMGFNRHSKPQMKDLLPDLGIAGFHNVIHSNYDVALVSMGTLGGGNHFIELQRDENGYIWVMIHSGSRNLGKQVADWYNKEAMILNHKFYSKVLPEWDLAFIPKDHELAESYMRDMKYCVEYAKNNRELMAYKIQDILLEFGQVNFTEELDIAHNYAKEEHHYGKNVIVHRKGATSAYFNQLGIIPGSQGSCSYIVKGKGNPESFMSCSHGAGRKMGRNQARKTLDLAYEQRLLDEKGIIHYMDSIESLDEATGAYKDIDIVMKEQEDLVDIVTKLTPIAVIKG